MRKDRRKSRLKAMECLQQLLIGGLLILLAFSSVAADFQGFATVGVGRHYEADGNLLDYGKNWSMRSDTLLGLQFDHKFNAKNQITLQTVTRGFTFDSQESFEPDIDWLFLSHQFTEDIRMRLGLLRLPFFLFSETVSVGYAHPWVRPPIDFYAPIYLAIKDYKGMDVDWLIDLPWLDDPIEMKLLAGRNDSQYVNTAIDGDLIGGQVQLRSIDYLLRYSLIVIKSDQLTTSLIPLSQGFQAFSSLNPIFQDIAESFYTYNDLTKYHALSVQWDHKQWSYISELNWLVAPKKGFFAERTGWYFSASRRWGKFTPYGVIGYSKVALNFGLSDLINQSYQALPEGAVPQLDGLRQAAQLLYEKNNQSAYSGTLGLRYDFHKQMALKFELQYLDSAFEASGTSLPQNSHDFLSTFTLDVIF